MPSSRAYTRRRKLKKRQKQQRRAARTRRLQQTPKKPGITIENVLGITAAVGYNENVLQQAAALSKRARRNYLTDTLVKKRVNYAKKMREKMLTNSTLQAPKNSPLTAALRENAPLETIEKILKGKFVDLEDQLFGNTPLEFLLLELGGPYQYKQPPTVEKKNKIATMIKLLIEKGARIRKNVMQIVWNLDWEDLVYYLERYSQFRHRTLVYKDYILNGMKEKQKYIRDEIREYQMENIDADVPDRLFDEYDYIEEKIRALKTFLESYNPETGDFLLEYPPNNFVPANNFVLNVQQNEGENFLNE